MAEAQKGVFDHLAEYLLQPAATGPAPAPAEPETRASAEGGETLAVEQPASAVPAAREVPGVRDKGGQTLVFVETAEKLMVEKELFVREEIVLKKLIEDHVQEIEDTVRRTEVEVQRLPPEEAERIAPAAEPERIAPAAAAEPPALAAPMPEVEPALQAPPLAPQAQRPKPTPAAAVKQAPRAGEQSASWWLWFALILCAGVLIAFAIGQFLGSG